MVNGEILEITDRICSRISPKKVYLFGSYARDSYNDESDYDFYVVVPDDAGDTISLAQEAYKSLRGLKRRPVDIVVGHESSFERRSNLITLEKTVKEEGVILYG